MDLLSMNLQAHFLRAQRASDNKDGCKGLFCFAVIYLLA